MNDITLKQVPIGEYEYVTAEFPQANTDVVIKYEKIRTEDLQSIRWIDIAQGGTADGTAALVYRVTDSMGSRFGPGYVVLRSTVAGYKTRLLLFTERN